METNEIPKELIRLLDSNNRVEYYPKKKRFLRPFIWNYIHSKIEENREYTEPEINAILQTWITFEDYVTIRRDLFENGYINRAIDGSKYWKAQKSAN
jgi:hypothetical protein